MATSYIPMLVTSKRQMKPGKHNKYVRVRNYLHKYKSSKKNITPLLTTSFTAASALATSCSMYLERTTKFHNSIKIGCNSIMSSTLMLCWRRKWTKISFERMGMWLISIWKLTPKLKLHISIVQSCLVIWLSYILPSITLPIISLLISFTNDRDCWVGKNSKPVGCTNYKLVW